MITRVVAWSARHSSRVLLAALVLAVGSAWLQRSVRRDVLPDLSDPQVVLVAEWMGHPATEVAVQVTDVVTRSLGGIPGATAVRAQSMTGMAYVDVVFRSTSEVTAGRAEIVARMERVRARLPAGARVQVGPEASSTGWIFQYLLVPAADKRAMASLDHGVDQRPGSLAWLRRFQDEQLRPALAALPGVAEVASLGGDRQAVALVLTTDRLRGAGLALSDVVASVRSRLEARTATVEQLRDLVVAPGGLDAGATPAGGASLGRVAQIRMRPEMANGIADVDGLGAAVGGLVVAKRDADVGRLARQVRGALEAARPRLPVGVQLVIAYDRSELTGQVQATLLRAVAEEIAVVALVVLLFLLHGPSAAIPMVTLPLVVLLTMAGMRLCGVTATIMSLGGIAIALGMAVDADLVALEACHRHIEARRPGDRESRRETLIGAAGTFAPAILISLVIAALSFLPVFAFGGESARLLRPLAITKTLVIGAAALCALTVAPALRDWLLRGRIIAELDNPITRVLVRAYRPFVHFALSRPAFTLTTAGLAALSCLPLVRGLGGEFLPRVDEGALLYMPTTSPGIAAADAATDLVTMDGIIAAHPSVARVFGKVGRADTATDPAPYAMIETTIQLKPRAEWPQVARRRWYSDWAGPRTRSILGLLWPERSPATTAEIVEALDRTSRLAGWVNAWTAPIRARLDMMSTGVHTEVGIRVEAGEPARLDRLGTAVQAAVQAVPGTRAAVYESLGGETHLELQLDHEAVARHDVDPALARDIAALVIAGGEIGEVEAPLSGGPTAPTAAPLRQRLPLRISLGAAPGEPIEQVLRDVTVRSRGASGQPVPLALIGRPRFVSAPAHLRSENGTSVGYVYVSLDPGVDVAGYVERARTAVETALASGQPRLRVGERLEWTGQYQLMMAGQRRLLFIAPAVALVMLALLVWQFRSLVQALIVLCAVPFALVGSVWTLFLLDYRLSAPVWVGLLSVVGLAMQTGVVMVVYIDDAFFRRLRQGQMRTRDDVVAAHTEGTVRRLRPKLMTIVTMAAGLLPLTWSDGPGAEILRRVAAPMLGGLATSAFLTLEVLPVLYTVWRCRQMARAARLGVPLEGVLLGKRALSLHTTFVAQRVPPAGSQGGANRSFS